MRTKIIISVSFMYIFIMISFLDAQQLSKFEKWQQPSFFKGFCISGWSNVTQRLVTQEEFNSLKATGANLAIIQSSGTIEQLPPYGPNVWGTYNGKTLYWQELLDTMVTFARKTRIYYILAIRTGPGRNDVAEIGKNTIWTDVNEQRLYGKMLKNIASRYLPDPLFVGFDLIQEPNPHDELFGVPVKTLDSVLTTDRININLLYKLLIDSVRTVTPDLPLMVQGVHWSNPIYFSLVTKQSDNKIVYNVHPYNPAEYSHARSAFSVTYPGSFWSISENKFVLFDKFFLNKTEYTPVRSFQQTFHIPVLIGEFGIRLPQNGGEQYMSDIMSIAESFGWHYSMWNWNVETEFNYQHFDQTYKTHYMDSISVYFRHTTTGVQNSNNLTTPITDFNLYQNYPNPFNPTTTIQFEIPHRSHIRLLVYDILGREVTIVVDDIREAGRYKLVWNGQNKSGAAVSSGVYFYSLVTDDFVQVRKLILLR